MVRLEAAMELTPLELATFPNNPDVVGFRRSSLLDHQLVEAGWLLS